MAATSLPLTDLELLAKYGLRDPLTDAFQFAQMTHALALARKAVLGCVATYQPSELVQVIYTITGTDSEGQPLITAADTARGALGNVIRELNKRYTRRMLRTQHSS